MRLLRGSLRVLLICLILAIGVAGAAGAVSQTAAFRQWLRGFIVAKSAGFLNGELSIGRLDGNLFFGVELHDVAVTLDGERLISLPGVALRYNAWQLITRGLTLEEIRLSAPALVLRERDGGWTIAGLLKRESEEADRQGPLRPLTIDRIVISDASIDVDASEGGAASLPKRIDSLNLTASFAYQPVRYSLEIESLAFRTTKPDLHVTALTGKVAVRDDAVFLEQVSLHTTDSAISVDGAVQDYLSRPVLNLRLASPQLSIPEIARFAPALERIDLRPGLTLKLDGPLDALKLEASAQSAAGSLAATLQTDLAAPDVSIAGHLSVQHLDLAPLLHDPRQKSDITGDLKIDLSGATLSEAAALSGTLEANARVSMAGYTADRLDLKGTIDRGQATIDGKVFAYGARLTASGQVGVPKPTDTEAAFNLRGRVERLNLRALPSSAGAPRVGTDISASYHVVGSQPLGDATASGRRRVDADLKFAPSTVPGLRVADGSTAHIGVRGPAVSYGADATLQGVDLGQIGEAFAIAALQDDRYRSAIDAHVVASGHGLSAQTLDAEATGTISRGVMAGGEVAGLQFQASMKDDTATLEATGAFAGFDPAVVSGRPQAHGQLAGDLTVDAVVAGVSSGLTLDNVSGDAQISLKASTVGDLAIDRAVLDAGYRDRVATVAALEVAGLDANMAASGTLVVGDEGDSHLTFHLDSSRLAEIGRILEAPLSGIARADGVITGNRRELVANGTLEGDGIAYQENGALTLRSAFAIRVPDLIFAKAHVEADSRATFVSLAGQNVNELTAKTTYQDERVVFDLSARQPQRQLEAAGALTIHADHQEIHLDRLALATAEQRWQVAAGEPPTIHYAKGSFGVEGLRLVSGDQEIAASGRFGAAGETLDVKLSNVDLAAVDQLLLRPPQFSGRVAASAKVSGTTDAPKVVGEFEVTSGGFRKFQYETLGGHVDYTIDGLTLDARLQQNSTQWITARGFVPAAVFAGGGRDQGAVAGVHVAPSPQSKQLDVTIDSSPLGLGLIQGFTTAVTDVDGTIEAHVHVSGAADDPHPQGVLTIAGGKLAVPATGVHYTNIAGRIDLQPDRVHIDQITVLDEHQSALSITGDLAVHAREVGGVQLWINAEDFKIIDNRLGNLRIQSAVEVAGELRAPLIRGDFGVSTGRIDLDELLAFIGPSAYSTRETQYLSTPAPATPAPASSSPFDAMRMNLRLTVPDDLVVKAASLQAPGASVALGALNVTLGGDLTALKDPGGPVRLLGMVNTVRGTYDFQGRRFEILRDGTVRFDGGEQLSPRLDIRTRREIQGVEALVNIRGTLDRPEIELRSTPSLEPADILSLIVFNAPINQLGEGDAISLSARAQSLAVGAVAGQLAQSIGNALNLDTFEINVAPDSGAAAELTLGQQVGKGLYVKLQQGVGDAASTNLIIEYALARWLRLQTNVQQGASTQQSVFRRHQGSGADLIFLFTK